MKPKNIIFLIIFYNNGHVIFLKVNFKLSRLIHISQEEFVLMFGNLALQITHKVLYLGKITCLQCFENLMSLIRILYEGLSRDICTNLLSWRVSIPSQLTGIRRFIISVNCIWWFNFMGRRGVRVFGSWYSLLIFIFRILLILAYGVASLFF